MNSESTHDSADAITQQDYSVFRRELAENLRILLELMDTIHTESADMGDHHSSAFFAGLRAAIVAFVTRSFGPMSGNRLVTPWPDGPDDPNSPVGAFLARRDENLRDIDNETQ